MCIRTDDMDLAGDIIQELCTFLNIDDLATTAEFPEEMEKLKEVLEQVRWSAKHFWQNISLWLTDTGS